MPGPLVTGAWLHEHLEEVRVVDCRWYLDGRSGYEAYVGGHLPSAVWLDLDTELSDPPTPADGRHPLPTPERFAAALGRVGIAEGTPVVVYDDAGGSIASRLWWLLHVLDEPVAVLDGGTAGWPGPNVPDVPRFDPVERAPRAWPVERFVTAAELAAAVDTAVFDARAEARYRFGQDGLDPRPGHIPGALSAPWAGNLDTDGRFRPVPELAEVYAAAADRPAVAYCGSGVTACHDLLALELVGNTRTALYPGSWSQWANDPARPAESG
jgi:thiosulfate/3-mercaptopyruvate sulfurtransferase